MRNAPLVTTIAAYLSKALSTHVSIMQGPQHTEWYTGERGFAVLNDGIHRSPKELAKEALAYLTPRNK